MKGKTGIFIPTCNREVMLQKLLDKLVIDRFVQFSNNDISIFVVDNDLNMSAKKITNKYANKKVFYFNEKQMGYASIRNKCLEVARSLKFDYMIFIDDDEIPCDNWVEKLYEKITNEDLDVVTGPVYPILTKYMPKWIINVINSNEAFVRDDENLRYSGNTIIRMKSIDGIYFDNNFDLYGGEDVQFFKMVNLKGNKKFGFEKNAAVYEHMPLNRMKFNYFLKRAYNSGIADVIAEKSHMNIKHNIKAFIKGLYNIVKGIYLVIISIPFGVNKKRIAVSTIFKGLGRIYAVIFIRYNKDLNLNIQKFS